MGNVTVTVRQDLSLGPFHAKVVDIAPNTSYAAGGDTIPLASLGLKTLQGIVLMSPYSGAALFHPATIVYGATPQTDPKLMMRDVVTGAEVTAAFNASTAVVRALAFGEGPFSN